MTNLENQVGVGGRVGNGWNSGLFLLEEAVKEALHPGARLIEEVDTPRKNREAEVARVAQCWLEILEQRGIETEGLPVRRSLENQQTHPVEPGLKFALGDEPENGIVEIGRWVEKRSNGDWCDSGISMKIYCGDGLEARCWLIEFDNLRQVTYFTENHSAISQETRLGAMKFTGELLGERSEQIAAELVRQATTHY